MSERLTAIATWIGQASALANHFPVPREQGQGGIIYLRDSQGSEGRRRSMHIVQGSGASPAAVPVLGQLPLCPRWEAVRKRIAEKQQAIPTDN